MNKADGCPEPTSTLSQHVETTLDAYFEQLDGHQTCDLYRLVMDQVEKPLLAKVMHHAEGNQTRASSILGINRSTLRKKLRLHGLT